MSQESSSEKTEKASPKKKEDARKRGEVHLSRDLVSAISLTVVFAALGAGYTGFTQKISQLFKEHLESGYVLARAGNINEKFWVYSYGETLREVLPIVLPLMLLMMVVGIALHLAQTGFIFTTERIKPKFSKIDPIQGFKRLFSMASVMEMLKSVSKIILMGIVIYRSISSELEDFPSMMQLQPAEAFAMLIKLSSTMGVRIGAVLTGLAAADIFYQWWKFEKDLRMTKQEVKEENKQMEGDPKIKGHIRQLQRRMSQRRMMRGLLQADVVVTNPTHFAVALRYREKLDPAPVVVAKGQDLLAQQIKKVAKEKKITIVENRPVARALYASCEIGQTIPADLYQAIADILIYVYKATNRMPTRQK